MTSRSSQTWTRSSTTLSNSSRCSSSKKATWQHLALEQEQTTHRIRFLDQVQLKSMTMNSNKPLGVNGLIYSRREMRRLAVICHPLVKHLWILAVGQSLANLQSHGEQVPGESMPLLRELASMPS